MLAGAYLFRIGDVDDSLYVVQKGLLHVFITDEVALRRFYSVKTNLFLETSSAFD